MKSKTIGFAVLAFKATVSAVAADLTLLGDSAAVWTSSSTIWTNSAGESVSFSAGDNILVSSDCFTGSSLRMDGRFNPGNVVFDIAKTLKFGWGNSNTYGLGPDTKSFTKRGSGTLILTSSLSGSVKNAAGGTKLGNGMTNGVDIVEGEIALVERNCHNFLGPRLVPYWVNVRDGASLTFLEGNQTGAVDEKECGIRICLEAGSKLNYITNSVTSRRGALSVNMLKLAGGDLNFGAYGYASNDGNTGAEASIKIFNTLHFAGATPHAFGFPEGSFSGYKHYSLDRTLKNHPVSLNAKAPVEIRVDDIDNGDGVDAYMNMKAFNWGAKSTSYYRCDIVKTGAGTLVFPSNDVARVFNGDFTVKEGRVEFLCLSSMQQFFRAGPDDALQTVTVSTNATLSIAMRNITNPGDGGVTPNIKIVIDHGTLEYKPGTTSKAGNIVARDWVFDDATLDISSSDSINGGATLYFKNSVTFRGTRPLAMMPDKNISAAQSVLVHNGTNTTGNTSGPCTIIDVADMTGDGRTDVVMGYRINNGISYINEQPKTWTDSGFIKTGVGTFSVASSQNGVSGVVTVSNGTMRVDGNLTTPSYVKVASGAFLGGTGTVARVSMESGSGFAAPAGQNTPLTVQGDLALPAAGVVEIANLDGAEEKDLRPVKLATATGSITGTENLGGWTVKVNGATTRNWQLELHGGILRARREKGFVIIFR